jgi:hypothetical protein
MRMRGRRRFWRATGHGARIAPMASVLDRLESFGAIDAETDFRPEFFVPSTSWENVRRQRHPLVVGRKGTGKTALRKALLNEAASDPVIFATDLTFRDYPWNIHHAVYDESVGGKSRYVETWLFLMLIELAKQAVGEDQAIPTAEAEEIAGWLRLFVQENWGSVAFDHRDIFRAKDYQVTRSFKPEAAGVSVGSVDWTRVPRARLGDSLNAMNRWLKTALARILREDVEHFLVFDELDLDFSQQDQQYLDSITGLVLATQNFYLWTREQELRVLPVILLRDDIYGVLQFPDKNKISLGLVETIQWNADYEGPNALKTVVDARIRALLDRTDDPGKDVWYEVFDEDVMRGTQHKYLHMAQRTYLRPRDLIQFGNVCLDAARARVRDHPDDSDRIANQDVTEARTPYSNYLRSELADEIFAHHPDWENWLELLRHIGTLTFTREQLDTACAERALLAGATEPAQILDALYAFSIIGFARRGGSGRGGTDEYWRYRDPEVTFDANAPYFKVHPGLKENLDLKEGR